MGTGSTRKPLALDIKARAPVPHFWLKIVRVILFTAAVTGVAVLVISQIPAHSNPPVVMAQNILMLGDQQPYIPIFFSIYKIIKDI
jgi:hypothetical protein